MERRHEIDYLRTICVLGMIAFHALLAFHLEGLVDIDFTNWRLEAMTTLIQLGFIGSAGVTRGLRAARPFRKEGLQILKLAGASGLISLVSYLVFPSYWVFFGILHFYCVATLLSPLFIRFGHWNIAWGLLWILFSWMNQNLLTEPSFLGQVLGFQSPSFSSLDFFPIFPWFGVYLMGMGFQKTWSQFPVWGKASWFSKIGAHTFWIYMLHLPFVFMLAKAWAKLIEVL